MLPRWLFAAVVAIGTAPAGSAVALEYPCPSDPGFCYRDFGDDGCFDSGTDDGPINAEIEASQEFPDPPPPGSIVCPPSVGELTASGSSIRLATDAGSSILIYAAEINADTLFDTDSGADLLIGGPVYAISSEHEAESDIFLGDRVKLNTGATASDLTLNSASGNIVVGPKVKIKASDVVLTAPGDITLLEKVVVQAKNSATILLFAGGTVELTKPKFKALVVSLLGADVTLLDKASIKAGFQEIIATDDVTIERLSAKAGASGFIAPFRISGTNVTMGVGDNGRVPRSKITYKGDQVVEIEATDTIDLDSVVLRSNTGATIETTGTTTNVVNSKLVGIKTQPTFEIAGGAGSTCDITGTVVVKGDLVTDCDTVIP